MSNYQVISSFLREMKYGYFMNLGSETGFEETKAFKSLKWEGACVGAPADSYEEGGIFYFPLVNPEDVLKAFSFQHSNVGNVVHYLCVNGPLSETMLSTIYRERLEKLYNQTKYMWTLKIITASVQTAHIQNFDTLKENLYNWFDLVPLKEADGVSYFYHSTYYYLTL